MITAKRLREWAEKLSEHDMVYIDEAGLTLCVENVPEGDNKDTLPVGAYDSEVMW